MKSGSPTAENSYGFLMPAAAMSAVLDDAYLYVLQKRSSDHPDSDIWDLNWRWTEQKPEIIKQLLAGTYRLSSVSVHRNTYGEYLPRWCAQDAVVLKVISMILSDVVKEELGGTCYHLKDCGGLKGAVREIEGQLAEHSYVLKSDIASFYASIDHGIVLKHCEEVIKDSRIIQIIQQYLNHLEILDGEYTLVTQGISKGCSLSPLIGALILKSLDKIAMRQCVYVRYMDDWVILTKTRFQLRRLVKYVHRVMHDLKFKLALDKTYIGRISKGFDFLGYRFDERGIVGLTSKTVDKFLVRGTRLYEQGASDQRIRCYVRRWITWVFSGLSISPSTVDFPKIEQMIHARNTP